MKALAKRLRRVGPILLVMLGLALTVPACGSITGPKFPEPDLEEPEPRDDNDPSQEG